MQSLLFWIVVKTLPPSWIEMVESDDNWNVCHLSSSAAKGEFHLIHHVSIAVSEEQKKTALIRLRPRYSSSYTIMSIPQIYPVSAKVSS